MFAVSGIMQAMLLLMCIAWKIRQRRLHIDDFGHPLPPSSEDYNDTHSQRPLTSLPTRDTNGDEEAAEERPPVPDEQIVRAMLGEDTSLLTKKGLSSSYPPPSPCLRVTSPVRLA